jgi:DNA-binding IclR family transcriptional regulator
VTAQLGTQAVDRAAALLALVVRSAEPQTFTALVSELALAKSTTSRLLQALERNGLVRRDAQGKFLPGPLFALYAARRDAATHLLDLGRPVLHRIAERTGETVNLAVPDGLGIVQIAQVDSRYLLGATNWIGVDVPTHCTAMGKVFYAYATLPLPRGPLPRRTPATITSVTDLARELDEVRRRGWAVTWDELEPGLAAIAAPVRGGDGAVVATVSVSGPTSRLTRAVVPKTGALLVKETRALSELLGWPSGKEDVA